MQCKWSSTSVSFWSFLLPKIVDLVHNNILPHFYHLNQSQIYSLKPREWSEIMMLNEFNLQVTISHSIQLDLFVVIRPFEVSKYHFLMSKHMHCNPTQNARQMQRTKDYHWISTALAETIWFVSGAQSIANTRDKCSHNVWINFHLPAILW